MHFEKPSSFGGGRVVDAAILRNIGARKKLIIHTGLEVFICNSSC